MINQHGLDNLYNVSNNDVVVEHDENITISNHESELGVKPTVVARKLVASIGRRTIFAIRCLVGHTRISLDVDTGAEVNVMPSNVFYKLKARNKQQFGGLSLQVSDLDLTTCEGTSIQLEGMVKLPVRLSKHDRVKRLTFYVVNRFAITTDGLIGLQSLRELDVIIYPKRNMIWHLGVSYPSSDIAVPLLGADYSDNPNTLGSVSVGPPKRLTID